MNAKIPEHFAAHVPFQRARDAGAWFATRLNELDVAAERIRNNVLVAPGGAAANAFADRRKPLVFKKIRPC
jgi:hypothetical protein